MDKTKKDRNVLLEAERNESTGEDYEENTTIRQRHNKMKLINHQFDIVRKEGRHLNIKYTYHPHQLRAFIPQEHVLFHKLP